MPSLATIVIALAVLCGLGPIAGAQTPSAPRAPLPLYDVHELPDLGGPFHDVHVFDVNDAGETVGYVLDSGLRRRAVRWNAASAVADLGGPSGAWSIARGISAGGVVAGFHGPSPQSIQPVLWVGGTIVALPHPSEGPGVEAYDVDDSLRAVGRGYALADSFAVAWGPGGAVAIGAPPSYAFSTNESGVAAGFVHVGGRPAAARWDGGALTVLPGLGVTYSKAIGVSPLGTIAGHADSASTGLTHAVVWRNGAAIDLGAYQGAYVTTATDVEDDGTVVGYYYLDPLAETKRALVWRGAGEVLDLNDVDAPDSGWILDEATAVNARGWIVGSGSRAGLPGRRAFVARPR